MNEDVEDNTYLYTLREVAAPDGYLEAEEIRFKLVKEVSPDGELKNSVYVYDREQKKWSAAEKNTVVMKDKPGVPEIPKKPKKPGKPKHRRSSKASTHLEYAPVLVMAPRTADLAHMGIYFGIIALSLANVGLLIWKRKKKKKEYS